jgi:3-phenylpropionate/cinnamic acid dioxygenase small subunit
VTEQADTGRMGTERAAAEQTGRGQVDATPGIPRQAGTEQGSAEAVLADGVLTAVVSRFLYDEAALLDDRRFDEWLALFCEDATYEVPLRVTREHQAHGEVSERGRVFSDTRRTLAIRVQRLQSEYAWAEQPPSRTRHFVTNVRADRLADGTVAARSNVLVHRSRGDEPTCDLYAGDRSDVLVPDARTGFRIRRRWLVLDQSNLTGNSLSVFL